MQQIADIFLRAGLVFRRPAAIDPAALEEEREASVAELRAHGGPGFGRREDLLRREALAVHPLVIGEGLADRRAVADPLAIACDHIAPVRPYERHEGVVASAVRSRGAGVERVRNDARDL